MIVDDFITFFNGIYCDYDGAYGDQCFDLANAYSRWIGGPRFSGATADLIFQQPGDFYTAIQNTPEFVPIKGDIVIFSWPHVGIATGNNSDTNQFELLEQNDPENSNCHIKVYPNYNGVIGVLRAKVLPTSANNAQVITDQTKIPQIDNMEVGAIHSTLMDLNRDLDNEKKANTDLTIANKQQASMLADLRQQLTDCQKAQPSPSTSSISAPAYSATQLFQMWLKAVFR